MFTDNNDEV